MPGGPVLVGSPFLAACRAVLVLRMRPWLCPRRVSSQAGFIIILLTVCLTPPPLAQQPRLLWLSFCPGAHGNQLADGESFFRLEVQQMATSFLLQWSQAQAAAAGSWYSSPTVATSARPSTVSARSQWHSSAWGPHNFWPKFVLVFF